MKAINFLCIKLKCDITEIHRQFCHLLSFVSLLSTNRAVDQVSSSYPKMSTTALASKKPSELERHAFISDDLGHTSRQKVVSGQLGHLQLDLHLQVAWNLSRDNDGEKAEKFKEKGDTYIVLNGQQEIAIAALLVGKNALVPEKGFTGKWNDGINYMIHDKHARETYFKAQEIQFMDKSGDGNNRQQEYNRYLSLSPRDLLNWKPYRMATGFRCYKYNGNYGWTSLLQRNKVLRVPF